MPAGNAASSATYFMAAVDFGSAEDANTPLYRLQGEQGSGVVAEPDAGRVEHDGLTVLHHDGVFDNRMMYYATEELWFPEWEHKGPYWEQQARHELHNPVNHVDQWRLPMLVIHGALDYRVPDQQGLAYYNTLKARKVDARLLWFPDENHWVLKPRNSRLWYEEFFAWLKAHDPAARPRRAQPAA